MIDKFIEMKCREFRDDRKKLYANKEIPTLESQLSEFEIEMRAKDKSLGDKLDVLFGDIGFIYSEVFFKEGFKQGLILAQEIYQLSLKEKLSNEKY